MNPRRSHLALGAMLLLGLTSCDDYVSGIPLDGNPGDEGSGSGDDGDPGTDTGTDALCAQDYQLTWDNWGSSFFATYCDSCHAASSPNRFGAPEDATFDTEQEIIDQWEDVYTTVIEIEWMPLGGGVYPEDLYLLEVYLKCSL